MNHSGMLRAVVGGTWLVVGQEQKISCKMQVVSCKGRTVDQEEAIKVI